EAADGEAELPAQLVEVMAAAVRKLAVFEQLPHALVRIELRRVRGQALQLQPPRGAGPEEVFDGLTAVNRCTIPDHEELAPHVPQQLPEEGDDRWPAERLHLHMGEEATSWGEGADRGEVVMREWRPQHRRLAHRGVGAGHEGEQIEARLVYEEDRAVL